MKVKIQVKTERSADAYGLSTFVLPDDLAQHLLEGGELGVTIGGYNKKSFDFTAQKNGEKDNEVV